MLGVNLKDFSCRKIEHVVWPWIQWIERTLNSNLLQWIWWWSKFLEHLSAVDSPRSQGSYNIDFATTLASGIFFLFFRKPISSVEFQTSNDLIEVIPSSNPCSQTDTEESFLLMKNGFKEDSTQDKYLKIYYATEFKEPQQGKCSIHCFLSFGWVILLTFVIFCTCSRNIDEIIRVFKNFAVAWGITTKDRFIPWRSRACFNSWREMQARRSLR